MEVMGTKGHSPARADQMWGPDAGTLSGEPRHLAQRVSSIRSGTHLDTLLRGLKSITCVYKDLRRETEK